MERMERDDQPTCGKGLGANAVLPAKLAELMAARAEVLERHTKAFDLTDPNAQGELDAHTMLARSHRSIAAELSKLSHRWLATETSPWPGTT